jgi:LysR family positive regulator for ilvC
MYHLEVIGRSHLEAFLEVVERRSIQAAARETGRSRATYNRYLKELRLHFDAPELLRRSPGQREGVLSPEGEQLAEQARLILARWNQWDAQTKDLIARSRTAVRVGALAGAFDLIVDLLEELRTREPDLPLRVVEYPEPRLLEGVASGEVDLAFGSVPEAVPRHLHFETLGPLDWAVIIPESRASDFPNPLSLDDLDGVPMIITASGPARERIEEEFKNAGRSLNAAFEVGSTPRMVEMVGRGFGVAIVSRFRTGFLPEGAMVRSLTDGPSPLMAGVFTRKGTSLGPASQELVRRARRRFAELSRAGSRGDAR